MVRCLLGFFRLLDFVLLVLQWIFFSICAKNLFLKRGRASLELSTLWGQSSFKQCSWNWGSKEMLPLRSAQCSKKVADGPIKKKHRKSYGRTYELIGINHTMSLTKQGENSFKKHTLAKVYIQRWPIWAFEL